ncbi:hypothetical protein [Lichenihabitans psoromatis]|uniref:hypothetical protein n=1 Tax=Lichenihabitans psoromatis TaxID=2528642 RepID=UPI0013F17BB6|nr:hypothetical protein [Lichenihabitans psoromatis]
MNPNSSFTTLSQRRRAARMPRRQCVVDIDAIAHNDRIELTGTYLQARQTRPD